MGIILLFIFSGFCFFIAKKLQEKNNLPNAPKKLPATINKQVNIEKRAKLPRNKLDKYTSKIPKETFELLWFGDSEFKNIDVTHESINSRFILSFDIEPSAIFTDLEIEKAFSWNLPYYPKYYQITPSQRYTYLIWLSDITQEINIGYVFLFYYGLERHIFCGKYREAFKMILKLREFHKNESFLSYSQDALLYCCIIYKDINLFYLFLEKTPAKELEITDLYLACLKQAGIGLKIEEIIKLARLTGFKNKRYIKNEYNLYCSMLKTLLNGDTLNLNEFEFNFEERNTGFWFANFSKILHEARHAEMPSLLNNKSFQAKIYNLLEEAHQKTKEELGKRRKKK